jgi:hypothetical protein
MLDLTELQRRVQHNCDLADAQHAGDYTLCTYLLRMREHYRWEQGLPAAARIPKEDLSDWLSAREAHYEALEQADWMPLKIAEQEFDAFEVDAINAALEPHGLYYGAGYGRGCRPLFFLAELLGTDGEGGTRAHICGRELARDLPAPVAMQQNGRVIVRRHALRQWLWEKFEEWDWRKRDNPLARAFRGAGFDQDPEQALEHFTEIVLPQVVAHEQGERLAGEQLGPRWAEVLSGLGHSRAEILLRAVRDHLADSLTSLPQLMAGLTRASSLESDAARALHFYFANLTGMRKALWPELRAAYDHWVNTSEPAPLREVVAAAAMRWTRVAQTALEVAGGELASDQAARIEDWAIAEGLLLPK